MLGRLPLSRGQSFCVSLLGKESLTEVKSFLKFAKPSLHVFDCQTELRTLCSRLTAINPSGVCPNEGSQGSA